MTQAVATAVPAGVDPRTRTQIVAAVLLGLFLAALDQTVVGTQKGIEEAKTAAARRSPQPYGGAK